MCALRMIRLALLGMSLGFGDAAASAQQVVPSSMTAGGVVLPSGPWETIRASYVDIHYHPAHLTDAVLYADFFEATHRGLRAEFSSFAVDELVQEPVRCGVWLHPSASKSVNAANALIATSYGSNSYCELHFLAPAAYMAEDRCCTKVGEPRDRNQLNRIAAHEYSTIVLDRINRQRGGWRFHSAPKWFQQGYEEYLACILATDHTRTVTLGKYRELVAQTPSRLRDGDVENSYIDGAVLIEFLHVEFGRHNVQNILSSDANSFEEALRNTLGIDQRELFERARAKLRAANFEARPARLPVVPGSGVDITLNLTGSQF